MIVKRRTKSLERRGIPYTYTYTGMGFHTTTSRLYEVATHLLESTSCIHGLVRLRLEAMVGL